jgi:hypothetical protein
MSKFTKFLLGAGGLIVAAGVGIQFVPVEGVGNNPVERFALDAPPEVEAILRRSCMDCHSNETRWPWYSRLAPASWLVMRDVRKGRSRFNMSEWGDTDEEERATDKESSWDQVATGEMPPWFYIPMHPDARLSDADKALLKDWFLKKQDAPEEKAGEPIAADPAPQPQSEVAAVVQKAVAAAKPKAIGAVAKGPKKKP